VLWLPSVLPNDPAAELIAADMAASCGPKAPAPGPVAADVHCANAAELVEIAAVTANAANNPFLRASVCIPKLRIKSAKQSVS
jgi:hypothetical protein